MSDRHEQARAEAERQVPSRPERGLTYPVEALDTHERNGFMLGAEWADANRTITREECLHVGGLVQSGWPLERILGQIGIEVEDES